MCVSVTLCVSNLELSSRASQIVYRLISFTPCPIDKIKSISPRIERETAKYQDKQAVLTNIDKAGSDKLYGEF